MNSFRISSSPAWPVLSLTLALCGAASAQNAAPFTLDDALARLDAAPSVTAARLSVQTAQTNLSAANTALGLTVSVNGSANYSGSSNATAADGTTATTAGSTTGSAGVNISLGLLPWASNQSGLQTAERGLALAQARLTEAQNSARLNVAQQYFAAVLGAQDADLAARTLALRQRQLGVAQTQQTAGNATAGNVLSAQAAVQSAQGTGLQAAASLDAARRGLEAALGSSIGDVTFSTQPPDTVTLPDVAALVAQARATRSEVITAQNTLSAAQDDLGTQQREATLPDLTASVRYGPSGSGGLNTALNLQQGTVSAGYSLPLGSSASSGSNRLSASVTGSYVVYSPAQKAQLSAAGANVTQAQLSLNVAQQNVELDVRTRYSTLQTGLIAVQTRETGVQVAQLALQTAQTRLQAGTGTADDVSAAELDLAQSERDLLSARMTTQTNLLQLQNAAGGPR
ncbi:TolC family protein [Deinococcus arenicola]|uniref:TolC family protein n=1 Tax=Deinococcus arenicola TaxID=2994950 RepID=A0ABU4DRB4_9DEIO|nr:TolC family protein [Deinococcus sp. ZS9-10]MDV6374967.1 TolC family protein [Deinococcus sp. ZS9-10]